MEELAAMLKITHKPLWYQDMLTGGSSKSLVPKPSPPSASPFPVAFISMPAMVFVAPQWWRMLTTVAQM